VTEEGPNEKKKKGFKKKDLSSSIDWGRETTKKRGKSRDKKKKEMKRDGGKGFINGRIDPIYGYVLTQLGGGRGRKNPK